MLFKSFLIVFFLNSKFKQEKPHSNWREQHKEFLRTVRNARNVSEAIKTGAPLPKFEPSAVPSGKKYFTSKLFFFFKLKNVYSKIM